VFTISFDADKRLLEIKLAGLLSVTEIDDLRLEILALMRMHGLQPGGFVALLDHTESPIQPQAVHEALVRFGKDPTIRPGRLAIWSGNAPSRMQSRRSEVEAPTRLFDRRAEALFWLLETVKTQDFPIPAPAVSNVLQSRSW
jgi:hypothetical protein